MDNKKSLLTGVSTSQHGFLIDPSGASGSARQEVLQGIPVDERFPDKDIWDVVTPSSYCSGVVHIPGEIEDPLTISKLSDLNKFLVNMRYDFHDGVIQPVYTQSLQRELDVTSAELLPAKLDCMFNREYQNWYNWWHFKTFGGGSSVSSPLDLCRECENWYYIHNLGERSFVPSPLEQLNYYPFLFCIIIICIAIIFLFWRIAKRKQREFFDF